MFIRLQPDLLPKPFLVISHLQLKLENVRDVHFVSSGTVIVFVIVAAFCGAAINKNPL